MRNRPARRGTGPLGAAALPFADQRGRAGAATAIGVIQQPALGESHGRIHARPAVTLTIRFFFLQRAPRHGCFEVTRQPEPA